MSIPYKKIIIYPHDKFDINNDEVNIQYYLASILHGLGVDIKIFNPHDNNNENTIFNCFISKNKLNSIDFENTIIIYTEGVIGNPLNALYVVRWILAKSEKDIPIDIYDSWGNNELLYFLNKKNTTFHDSEKYIKYLSLFYINRELKNRYRKKSGCCIYNDFQKDDTTIIPYHNINELRRLTLDKKIVDINEVLGQVEYGKIFDSCKIFLANRPSLFLNIIASLCGCVSVINPIKNVTKQQYFKMTGLEEYMQSKNIEHLYGIAYGFSKEEIEYAQKTKYLVESQVKDIETWFINNYVITFLNEINNLDNKNTMSNYKNFILSQIEDFYCDIHFYLHYNPDLSKLNTNYLYTHYELYGKKEKRIASPQRIIQIIDGAIFDIECYRLYNDDLKDFSSIQLIKHYKLYGKKEGRLATYRQFIDYVEDSNFDLDAYRAYNNDLNHLNNYQLLKHYKEYGKKQGRSACFKQKINQNKTKLYRNHNTEFIDDNIHISKNDMEEQNEVNRIISNTNINCSFDFALVFICHDSESFMKVSSFLKYENAYIIFVGDKEYDFLYENYKIIIARNYTENIEKEKKLLTFTAWYLIVKNDLFANYSHICLLEYDVIFSLDFLNKLNKIYMNYDLVSFNGGINSFNIDINIEVFKKFIKIKNIESYNAHDFWFHSTNHCIKRELLSDFVEWYYPACFFIKLYDYKKLSYYHERLFNVYLKNSNYTSFLFSNNLTHIQNCSHKECKNAEIKKIFLTYNDASNNYLHGMEKLVQSVHEYSDFETKVFYKKEIDEFFKTQNQCILSEKKGGGFWLWKPYIILTILNQLHENDILFYLDSKYYFVENFVSLYDNYFENTGKDILVWENKPNEEITYLKNYCKMDVIQKYQIDDLVFNKVGKCCWAGAIMIKKTELSLKIVKEWLELCCDYDNINDSINMAPHKEFIAHRHDQSLLSIVLHKYDISFNHFPKKYLQNVRIPW